MLLNSVISEMQNSGRYPEPFDKWIEILVFEKITKN